MITSKERSSLRALAHSLVPVVIVGKEGLTDALINSVDDVLEARELIKIRLLNNCPLQTREVSAMLCEKLSCEGVQCIGSIVVLYRYSKKKDIKHIAY
ncbi:MAG: ribosome assembly RNA-binding protein YhbY [Clostridiales bacterium]|nr:ribosome assembly RNA-binding protein YhbY [Candidatus Apopatousia equi]